MRIGLRTFVRGSAGALVAALIVAASACGTVVGGRGSAPEVDLASGSSSTLPPLDLPSTTLFDPSKGAPAGATTPGPSMSPSDQPGGGEPASGSGEPGGVPTTARAPTPTRPPVPNASDAPTGTPVCQVAWKVISAGQRMVATVTVGRVDGLAMNVEAIAAGLDELAGLTDGQLSADVRSLVSAFRDTRLSLNGATTVDDAVNAISGLLLRSGEQVDGVVTRLMPMCPQFGVIPQDVVGYNSSVAFDSSVGI